MSGRSYRLLAGLAAASVLSGFLVSPALAATPALTTTPATHRYATTATSATSAPLNSSATSSLPTPSDHPSNTTLPIPDSTPEPALDLGTVPNVHITSVGEPLLTSGADLKVQAVISNPTKKPLTISSVSLLGQDWAPDTRGGVLDFLDGGPTSLSQLGIHNSVSSVPAEQTTTVDFTIPRAELDWQDSFGEWGPRGIEVEVILEDDTDLTDRSLIVVAPGFDLTPMPTGVVVPITKDAAELSTYPPLSTLLETIKPSLPDTTPSTETASDPPSEQTSPAGTPSSAPTSAANPMVERAERYRVPGVTAVVDPSLLHTAEPTMPGNLETNPSVSLQSAVDAFVQQTNTELIFTPMHDVDVQALVRGSAMGYLQSAQLLSEEFAVTQAKQPRTDVALLPSSTDQRTVAALASTGVTAVILPDSDVPQAGFRTSTASARSEIQLDIDASGNPLDSETSLPALTIDSVVSNALSGALNSGDAESDSESETIAQLDSLDSRQLVLALSAATYLELPNEPRAMLLALNRAGMNDYGEGDTNPGALQTTLTALMAAPWVTPTTVSEMLNLDTTYIEREQLTTAHSLKNGITHSQLTSLDEAENTIARYANLSSDPSVLMTPTRDAIGRALALAWRSDPSGQKSQISHISSAADAMLTKLQVLPSSTINIISQATELPVHVSNDLPVPVTIAIRLDSYDNRLKQTKPVAVTLQARQSSTIPIPVEARGSGNIQTSIRMFDPSGNEIGSAQTLEIRVRADWENLGTAIIAAFFGAILLFGVIKSLRRGKQHAAVDPAEFAKADRERRGGVPASGEEAVAGEEAGTDENAGSGEITEGKRNS